MSTNNNSYDLTLSREKFIRSFAPMTLEAKQIKQWSAPTSMSFVTSQNAVVTIGKDVQDQKTEYQSAPPTVSPEVTIINTTHDTITVSLAKPPTGELNGYLVETYIGASMINTRTVTLDGSSTLVIINNLNQLTTYNLKVYSTNIGGTKSELPTLVPDCKTLPSPPQFSVFGITPQSFKLYYSALPPDVVFDVSLVSIRSLPNYVSGTDISGLVAGIQYTVIAKSRVASISSAYNGLISLPSQLLVWTLLNAPIVNSATSTTNAITLDYTINDTVDAGTFQNTILQTKTGGFLVSTLSTTSPSTISVSGLTADTQYDLSLVSIYTNTKTDTHVQSLYTYPISPTITTNVLNNYSAQITFTQLLNHIYDVSAIPVSGTVLSLHNISSPYILNSLTPSTTYTVVGKSKFVTSGLTSIPYSTNFITTAAAPSISSIDMNSDISGIIHYSIYSATSSSGALTNIRITLTPRTGGVSNLVFNTTNTSAYTMTGLTPNTVYDVSMISIYENNQSDIATSTFTTQPSVPTGTTISNLSYTSAKIFFSAISGLAYDVSAIPNVLGGGANFMSQTDISSGFTITGLSEGTSYNIYLFARNSATRSKPAILSSIITLLSAPTGLSISHLSYTSMWLHYTPVSGLAYDATVSDYNGIVETRTGISSGEIFDNLSEGITYTFSLTARKDRTSVPSTISETTLLHPPTDLSITDVGFNEFTVSFTQLLTIDQYDISAIPAAPDAALIQFEGVNDGDIVSGLTQGMSYTVYLHAHTHDAKSAPITRNIVTLLESPTGVSVTDISYDAVTVSFDQNPEYTYTVHLYSVVNSLTYLEVNSGDRLTNLSQGTTYTLSITTNSTDQISSPTEIEFTTVLNSSDGLIVVPEYTTCLIIFEQVPGLMYDVSAIPLNAYNNTVELVDVSSGSIVSGLSEGAYYTLYLTTYTADIRNPPTSIDFNTYLSPPANLTISDISFTFGTLTFTQNPDYVYVVDVQTNEMGGLSYDNFVSGNTLEGLPQGLYIDVYIYATSPDGIVGYSANTTFLTLLQPPKQVLASNIGTDNFTMYFNSPFVDPNTGEVPYNIYYDASAVHMVKNTVLTWTGVYNGYVANGLEEGAPYRLFVNAYTDDNVISKPATFDFVTNISIPTGLSSTDVSFKSFRVWFTTLFGFTYDISAVPTIGTIVSASNVSPGYLFNNTLEEGMTYTVQVYAKTSYKRSPAATLSVTTTLSPPQNVTTSYVSFTSFNVNFTQTAGLYYDVAIFDVSNVKLIEKTGVNTGVAISSADSASIVEGQQYTIKVYARSSYQISVPTTISVTTLLSPPTGLIVTNVGYNQFDVYFNQLPGLLYDISAVTEAGVMVQATNVTFGHRLYVATQGVLYNVYVTAYSPYKRSLPAYTSVITNLEAPANFSVDTISYTSAKIHFDASLGLVYDLSAIHSDGTIRWIESVTPGQTITGLYEGIAYTFDLFAERYGYKYSDRARATFTTLLQAPTGLSISDILETSFKISFTEIAGLTYNAIVSDGSNDIHTLNGIVSGTVVSGLLEGTQYSISLVAKTAAQTSNATSTTAITLLSAPTGVSVSNISYTSVVVNATSISGLIYDVSLIAQSNSNKTQITGYTLGSSITVPYDGVTYDVYVYARSAHIRSPATHLTVTTLLHEPTGLAISQIQNTSVYLAYTTIAGLTYRVVFHPSAGDDITIQPASPNVTVSGLIPATSYTVSLYAISAYTTSSPTIATFVTYTNAPTGTSITSTETTMTLSYSLLTASTDTGAFVQTNVRAVPRVSGATKTAIGDLTTVTIIGLTRGIIYDLSLVATYANTKSMALLDNSFTIVNAPTGLSVSNILNTSCVVSFNTDADLIYDMSAIPLVSGATVQTSSFVSGSTVVGLTAGTSYVVYVRGYTAGGIYSSSATSSFITKLGAITGITTSSTETIMTLNYTTPSPTTDAGSLSFTNVAAKSRTDASVTYASGNAITTQLSGLVVGTVYDISLVAVYTNTTSLTSTIVANTGVGTPTNVVASVTGPTTASITYDAFGGYMYDISSVPLGGVGTIVTVTDHVYGTGLTGLTQATKYRVYVYAKSGGFRSSPAYSDIVTYYSTGPTNGGVVATETQLTITYSYPATNTDSGNFQKLVVYAKSKTDGTSYVLESSSSPALFGGLVKGTVYDMSMIAMYQYTQSAITTFTTNTIVNQPTGLTVSSKTDTTVTITSAVFNDVVYDVSAIPASGTTVTATDLSYNTIASGYTFTGLVPGRLYTIYERARVNTVASTYTSVTVTTFTSALTLTVGTITATSIAIGYTGASVVANSGAFVNVTGTATNVDDAADIVNGTATTTPIVFTGLRQGAKYNMVVVANFANTTSIPATSLGNVTLISAPSAVAITPTSITNNQCIVTFTPDTGYTYDISVVMVTSPTTQLTYSGVLSGDVLSGLSQATRYYVYLFKKSVYATSPASVASSAFYTKVASIPYATITPYGGAFTLTYNTINTFAESGALVSVSYVATPVSGGSAITGTVSSGLSSSFTISGLASATIYDLSYSYTFANTTSVPTIIASQTTTNTMLLLKNKANTTIASSDITGIYTITNSGTTLISDITRGNIYSFTASSYLNTTGSPLRGNMTIAFWILYDTVAKTTNFSFIRSNWLPLYFASGKFGMNLYYTGTSVDIVESAVSTDVGRWMHYVLTTDLSTHTASIYKNGILDTTWTDTANTTLIQSTTTGWGRMDLYNTNNFTLNFGNSLSVYTPQYYAPAQAFKLDDIQIYSRAFSGSEIETMYSDGLIVDKPVYTTSATSSSITATFAMYSGYTYDASITPSGTLVTGITSPYTFSSLSANTQYTIAITANYSGKTSTYSTSTGTTFAAPTGLTFVSNTTSSITIAWTAPSGGTPSSYKCYIVPTAGGSSTMTSSATTSVTFTGLISGTEYSMTVVATNSYGDSVASSALVYGTVLGAPSSLTSSNITDTTFTLGFTPPVVSGSAAITSYTATCIPSSGTTVIVPFSTSDTSYSITGLVSTKVYTVTMTATYAYGTSVSSSSISVTTLIASPTGLTKTLNTDNTITISYTDANSASTIYYDVSATASSAPSVVYNQRFNPKTVESVAAGTATAIVASTSNLANCIGCTISSTAVNNVLMIYASGTTPGLYVARRTNGVWSASSAISITGILALTGSQRYSEPQLSLDGTRLIVTVGTWGGLGATADNKLYYANTTSFITSGTSLSFTAFETTASRSYTYSCMSDDGNLFFISGYSSNDIFVSKWNVSGYSALTSVMSLSLPLAGLSFANNKLIYMTNAAPMQLFWSLWTGNALTSGVLVDTMPSSSPNANAIALNKLNPDVLLIGTPGNVSNHYLNIWNGTTFGSFIPIPTTSILNTLQVASLCSDTSGNFYIVPYNATSAPCNVYATTITLSSAARSAYTIYGLQNADTSYNIALKTYTSISSSAYSSALLTGTTTKAPTGLTVTATTPTSIQVSFTPPSGNVLSYSYAATPFTGTAITGTFSGQSYILITGLQSNTVYSITISAINAYGTSPASVALVTETASTAMTNLTSTAYDLSNITVSYTDTNKNLYAYDMSATSTTKQFNQRFMPYTASVAPTFVAGSTFAASANILYNKGIAATNAGLQPPVGTTSSSPMSVLFVANNSTTAAGISYYRYINYAWSVLTALTLSFATTHSPTNPNINAIAVTANCTRLVIAYGSYVAATTYSSATNCIYWADLSGMLATTAITGLTFNNVDSTSRAYLSIALSDDGSKLVAGDNNGGVVGGYVYFATWNASINNYNALAPILDTTARVCWGLALSPDGNKLIYSGGTSIYWTVWNGTNYKAGTLIGTAAANPYDISLFKSTDCILIAPVGLQPQYSYWTGTGYSTITNTPTFTTAGTVFGLAINDVGTIYYAPYSTTAITLTQSRITQSLTFPISFGTSSTIIASSASLINCYGMAMSAVGTPRLALFGTSAGIYQSQYTTSWQTLASISTLTFDITVSPVTPVYRSINLTQDGTRCTVLYGTLATANWYIYWADTTAVLNGTATTSLAFKRINDSNQRTYVSLAMSGNGSRLVACNSTGFVYFSTWNPIINNYNTLTPILDTTSRTLTACALSADGNTLLYSTANTAFYSVWNGSNYNGGLDCFGNTSNAITELAFMGTSANYALCMSSSSAPLFSKWNGTCYTQWQTISSYSATLTTYAAWSDDSNIYSVAFNTVAVPCNINAITVNSPNITMNMLDTSTNYNIVLYGTNNVGSIASNTVIANTTYPPAAPSYTATVYGGSIALSYTVPTDTTHYGTVTTVKASAVNGATVVYATNTVASGTITLSGLTGGTSYDISMSTVYTKLNSLQGDVTTYTTSYLMSQLYNKTATIGATDAAGNAFTISGTVAMTNDAVRSYVYNISTTTSYLRYASSTISQNCTLAFWIKYNSVTMKSVGIITSKFFPVYYDGSGLLTTQLYSSAVPYLQEPTRSYDNEWVHYTFTIQTNGTTNGTAKLYKNGALVSSVTNTNLSTSTWGTVTTFASNGLNIGYPNSIATYYTDSGMSANFGVVSNMDDFRIYSKTYTDVDVSGLFINSLGTYYAPQNLFASNVMDTSIVLNFQMISATCVGTPVFNGTISDGTNVITLTNISAGYVATGLTAVTAYTVTLNYTLNGITSPNATLSVTTASVPSTPTNLSISALTTSSATISYTGSSGALYYDVSAISGSTVITTQRFISSAVSGTPTIGAATQLGTGSKITSSQGMCITDEGSYRLLFITGNAPSTSSATQFISKVGLQCIKYSAGAWGTIFYPKCNFDIAPLSYSGVGCAITPNGSKLLVSFGSMGANSQLYWCDARGFLYGTATELNFKQVTSTASQMHAIAVTSDGARAVISGYSGGNVRFTTWNPDTNNYNALVNALTDATQKTIIGGIAISNTGDRIAFIEIGTNWYIAYWNGTNYGNSILGGTVAVSGRFISFLGKNTDAIVYGTSGGGVYWTVWNDISYNPGALISGTSTGNWFSGCCDLSNIYTGDYSSTTLSRMTITFPTLTTRTSYKLNGLPSIGPYTFKITGTNSNYVSSLPGTTSVTSVTAPTFTNTVTTSSIALNYTATTNTSLLSYLTLNYYKMVSGTSSGNQLYNYASGKGVLDATMYNGPIFGTTSGKNELQFDASLSQYVQLPSFTIGTAGFAFACWFRSNNTADWGRIFDFGNGAPADNIYLGFKGNKILFDNYPASIIYDMTSDTALNTSNAYYHLALVLGPNDANGNCTVKLYINGTSTYTSASYPYPPVVTRTLNYIGKSNWSTNPYFKGAMFDVCVWNREITSTEVTTLYNNPNNIPMPVDYGALTTVAASAKTGATTVYGTSTTSTGTITLSGLTTATTYDVSMSALYAKGWGASGVSSIRTL